MSELRYGIADLPPAGIVTGTDSSAICQSPNGCFAVDPTVTLLRVTQQQLGAYYLSRLTGTPPITYDNGSGSIALAHDATLSVVGGQLSVVPPPPQLIVPSAPLLSGNGTILGSVALGTNLSLTGGFPNQTLNAAGITGGPFLPLTGGTVSGEIISSLNPINADALTTNRLLNDGLANLSTAITTNFLALAGGTMTGNITFSGINMGLVFPGLSGVYEDVVGGAALRLRTGNLPATIEAAGNPGGTRTPIITQTSGDARYLQLSTGGTLTGNLMLPAGAVGTPALAIGFPNRGFYATGNTLSVSLNGISIWGFGSTTALAYLPIEMNANKITGLGTPTDPNDAVTKAYADSLGGGGAFLPLTGGTLTGPLQLPVGTVSAPGLRIGGGVGATGLYVVGTSLNIAVNSSMSWVFTQTQVTANSLLAMGGQRITNLGAPTTATDAVTRTYADTKLALAGGTMTGPLAMSGNGSTIQTIYGGGLSGKAIAIGDPNTGFDRSSGTTFAAPLYLYLASSATATTAIQTWDLAANQSQLALNLNMTNHQINFLAEPTAPGDAATRNYVDTRPGGGGGITGVTAGAGISVTPDPVSPTVAVTAPLPINLGGTNGTTAAQARTSLGVGNVGTQSAPLGTIYGGTALGQPALHNLLAGGGTVGAPLVQIPPGAVNTVLHGGAPPSYGPVNLAVDVIGTLPLSGGGTGATAFTPGNLIGMGGGGAFVGVPTPLTVVNGGTGAQTFSAGSMLYGADTSPVVASSLFQVDDVNVAIVGTVSSGGQSTYTKLDLYRSRGTPALPSPVVIDDPLGAIEFRGYGPTDWATTAYSGVQGTAFGTFAAGSQPAGLWFYTTLPARTTPSVVMLLHQGLQVGNVGDQGVGSINAANYFVNGTPHLAARGTKLTPAQRAALTQPDGRSEFGPPSIPMQLGETAMVVLAINDTDGLQLQDVTLGAADSGGPGFRALRVPN